MYIDLLNYNLNQNVALNKTLKKELLDRTYLSEKLLRSGIVDKIMH
jgi:hypothetical protein